ncbi:MAG: restriction endonuclease subunit S [Prevotella sp.]|nr:restriction endonuclease subunit S [Prevotella sp.]
MNVPHIRFENFNDGWVKKKLQDICINQPSDLIQNKLKHSTNGYPVFGASGFIDNIEIYHQTNPYIGIVKDGAGVGRAYIYPAYSSIISTMQYILPLNDCDLSFICNNLNRLKLSSYMTGSTIPHIYFKDYSLETIFVPTNYEQCKISTCFHFIDSLIEISSKKLVSLQQIKEASLQSMFPQEGEATPKVRFRGFKGEWKKIQSDKIFETFNERNRPDLPVLSAFQDIRGMAIRGESGYEISHDKKNETTYKVVRPGQFVIHLRSFQGGFAHSSVMGITSPAYTVFGFKEEEKNDDYFWKIIFMSKSFVKRLEAITYGIRDGRSISYSEFSKLEFCCPSKQEQQSIAAYFRNLDKQIRIQEQRLELMKRIKSACLDKMFV